MLPGHGEFAGGVPFENGVVGNAVEDVAQNGGPPHGPFLPLVSGCAEMIANSFVLRQAHGRTVNGEGTHAVERLERRVLIDQAADRAEQVHEDAMGELPSGLRDRTGRDEASGDIPFEDGLEELIELVHERAFHHVGDEQDHKGKWQLPLAGEECR